MINAKNNVKSNCVNRHSSFHTEFWCEAFTPTSLPILPQDTESPHYFSWPWKRSTLWRTCSETQITSDHLCCHWENWHNETLDRIIQDRFRECVLYCRRHQSPQWHPTIHLLSKMQQFELLNAIIIWKGWWVLSISLGVHGKRKNKVYLKNTRLDY